MTGIAVAGYAVPVPPICVWAVWFPIGIGGCEFDDITVSPFFNAGPIIWALS